MKYTCEYCDIDYWWNGDNPFCPRCGCPPEHEPCQTCVRSEQEDDGEVD